MGSFATKALRAIIRIPARLAISGVACTNILYAVNLTSCWIKAFNQRVFFN